MKLPKPLKVLRPTPNYENRLVEKHFPAHFPLEPGYNKSSKPSKLCNVCNFSKKAIFCLTGRQVTIPHKFASYYCPDCNVALCIEPCFWLFHLKAKYEKKSDRRMFEKFIVKLILGDWLPDIYTNTQYTDKILWITQVIN